MMLSLSGHCDCSECTSLGFRVPDQGLNVEYSLDKAAYCMCINTSNSIVCTSRSWATGSMDEDGRPIPKRKSRKGGISKQWVMLGVAAAAFAVALQLMPGGVLSETPLAIALQRNVDYVGHLIGRVR